MGLFGNALPRAARAAARCRDMSWQQWTVKGGSRLSQLPSTAVCAATRVRGSRSVMLIRRSARVLSMRLRHGEETSCSNEAIPQVRPLLLGQMGHVLGNVVVHEGLARGKPNISSPECTMFSTRIRAMRSWPGSQ